MSEPAVWRNIYMYICPLTNVLAKDYGVVTVGKKRSVELQ